MDVLQLDLGGGGSASATSVNVHPVALLSILDNNVRRGPAQDRVIGGLLGTYSNGVYEVTNSFGVYFEIQFNPQKNEDELMIRRQTLLDMIDLHKKANPKEILVGWFSTWTEGAIGPDGRPQHIDDFALVVQRDIIADAAVKKGGVSNPIMLLVDTSMNSTKFGLYSYLPVNNPMTQNLVIPFRRLKTTLVATIEERVAMDAMTRCASGSSGPATVTPVGESRPVAGDVEVLDGALKRLRKMLDSVCTYVDEVADGKKAGDEAVGRAISDALSAVPRILSESGEASAASRATQDVLMVSYLTTLAQRQLELAERIAQMPMQH